MCRLDSEQCARVFVGREIQKAIGVLAHVVDPLPQFGERGFAPQVDHGHARFLMSSRAGSAKFCNVSVLINRHQTLDVSFRRELLGGLRAKRQPAPPLPPTPFLRQRRFGFGHSLGYTLRIGYCAPACSPNHRLRSVHACESFGNGFICAMKIEPGKFPQSWA